MSFSDTSSFLGSPSFSLTKKQFRDPQTNKSSFYYSVTFTETNEVIARIYTPVVDDLQTIQAVPIGSFRKNWTSSILLLFLSFLRQLQEKSKLSYSSFNGSLLSDRSRQRRIFTGQALQDFQEIQTTALLDLGYYPVHTTPESRRIYSSIFCGKEPTSEERKELLNLFSPCQILIHRSLDLLLQDARENPDDFGLLFYYGPEACYSSGRIKSRMEHLREEKPVLEITSEEEQLLVRNGMLVRGEDKYLPVLRYSTATGSGFYDESSGKEYCGTFYYLEPESDVVLRYQRSAVYRNKVEAVERYLQEEVDPPRREELTILLRDFWVSVRENSGKDLPELRRLLRTEYNPIFYMLEDIFDQEICRIGQEQGLDVMIFSEMTGSREFITEVLDVRSRSESYRNLYELSI